MKTRIFIILFTVLFSAGSQANIFTSTSKKIIILESIAVAASLTTIAYTIATGNGLDKSIKIVNVSSKTAIGRQFYEEYLLNFVLRLRYSSKPKLAHNAMNILQGSVIYTPEYERMARLEFSNYDENVKILTLRAEKIKKKYQCLGRSLIYDKGIVIKPEKGTKPVHEWDYGSYLYLKSIEPDVTDYMEHDHIPSIKAILIYLEKRDSLMYGKLLRDEGIGRNVMNNTTAIEVTKSLHAQGRTWFHKQGKKVEDKATKSFKKLYELDSEDLFLATILDFAEYIKIEKKLTPLMTDAFDAIIERNTKLCLYE